MNAKDEASGLVSRLEEATQTLQNLVRDYSQQGQFSVPFLLKQIELLESNQERIDQFSRRLDKLSKELYGIETKLTLLERRVKKLESK